MSQGQCDERGVRVCCYHQRHPLRHR
jgi:hypothetical protein